MTTAIAARAVEYVFVLRRAAKLEGLVHKAPKRVVQFFQFLPRLEESLRHRVLHQLLAKRVKLRNFLLLEQKTVPLFCLEQVVQAVDLLELKLHQFVAHERIQLFLE